VIYKLPEEEIAIGKRLRAFREDLKIPRTVFALDIGLTSERLASYEAGRARLPWNVFILISKKHRLNPFWLIRAEGGPLFPCECDYSKYVQQAPSRAAFSHVLRDVLEKGFDSGAYQLQEAVSGLHLRLKSLARLLADRKSNPLAAEILGDWPTQTKLAEIRRNMPLLISELLRQIVVFSECEFEQAGVAIELFDGVQVPCAADEKKKLTDSSLKGILRGVKSPLQVLLARVARATAAQRGKQAALAAFLKVSPSRVSEWVRGVKEPGGDYALRLLSWVTAEEAQQKTPGGAENAAKGKTRLPKENHEKPGRIKP